MEFIYNFNALPFLNKRDLMLKDYLVRRMEFEIQELLLAENKSWRFVQIEAPCLIPRELVNANYTDQDIWIQEQHNHDAIVLKPETTASSYLYMENLLKSQQYMPPLCVWQTSKSFRREQDQVTKHCRYKESINKSFNVCIQKTLRTIIKKVLLNH